MSLEVQKVDSKTYICNQCRKEYNIDDAWYAKGNIYFCSMGCILEDIKENQ